MNTAIIETHYHSEYLNTLIQLYPQSDVYTTRQVYDDLPDDTQHACTFCFPGKTKTRDFLKMIPTEKYDLLFVNTIQETMLDLRNWIDFRPRCRTVLTLHNLNAWHTTGFHPRLNILHSFDSWISKHHQNKILSRFHYLSVCYEPMLPTAAGYFMQPTVFIPFTLAKEKTTSEKHDDIWFTIPGTVTAKRRDYTPVIEAFQSLLKDFSDVRLYLLGKNEDQLMFDDTRDDEERIVTYDKTVPRDQYDQILRDSDFIIVPSVTQTHTINSADEQYGYTKSPNIHEAFKWRKPAVVPASLPVPYAMVLYTAGDDLYRTLRLILSDDEVVCSLKDQAKKYTERYLLKNVKKRLEKELMV